MTSLLSGQSVLGGLVREAGQTPLLPTFPISRVRDGYARTAPACGGAHDEFLLTATVQNLRRMVKLLGQPPANHRIGASA